MLKSFKVYYSHHTESFKKRKKDAKRYSRKDIVERDRLSHVLCLLQGTRDLFGQAGPLYGWEFQNGDLAQDRSREGCWKIYREAGWRKVWMFKEARWSEEETGTEHEEERAKGRVSPQWFSRCWDLVRRLVALFVEMFILASETIWTFARIS